MQGILSKLALLAYIDTLVVQPKRTHNKSVVQLKNTRDQRPLAVSNQKGWNAALSLNFIMDLIFAHDGLSPGINISNLGFTYFDFGLIFFPLWTHVFPMMACPMGIISR